MRRRWGNRTGVEIICVKLALKRVWWKRQAECLDGRTGGYWAGAEEESDDAEIHWGPQELGWDVMCSEKRQTILWQLSRLRARMRVRSDTAHTKVPSVVHGWRFTIKAEGLTSEGGGILEEMLLNRALRSNEKEENVQVSVLKTGNTAGMLHVCRYKVSGCPWLCSLFWASLLLFSSRYGFWSLRTAMRNLGLMWAGGKGEDRGDDHLVNRQVMRDCSRFWAVSPG